MNDTFHPDFGSIQGLADYIRNRDTIHDGSDFLRGLDDYLKKNGANLFDDSKPEESKKDDASTSSLAGDKGSIEDRLRDEIALLKTQLENERNKMISPIPNPDTGEVPLRTGVAAAILDKNGPKPKSDKKENRKKLKMSLGKTKIVVDPDVDIGQISGGIQTGTGNLH